MRQILEKLQNTQGLGSKIPQYRPEMMLENVKNPTLQRHCNAENPLLLLAKSAK
jgi:hypothetical protein